MTDLNDMISETDPARNQRTEREDSTQIPDTLQQFLSLVGVVHSAPSRSNGNINIHDNGGHDGNQDQATNESIRTNLDVKLNPSIGDGDRVPLSPSQRDEELAAEDCSWKQQSSDRTGDFIVGGSNGRNKQRADEGDDEDHIIDGINRTRNGDGGAITNSEDGDDDDDDDDGNDRSSQEDIFESSFDLSEERLKHFFDMFDTNMDGRISYEGLRRGLDFHAQVGPLLGGNGNGNEARASLDERSFNTLVQHLDLDQSGDISFEEFSEGIRLLMLRALFHPSIDNALICKGSALSTLDMYDYNSNKLERRVVQDSSAFSGDGKPWSDVQPMSRTDLFFKRRPAWVKTRWINVVPTSPATAALTLKRLAVRYSLHPLALDDALYSQTHRPKVEVFSNHYLIMVPVLCMDGDSPSPQHPAMSSSERRNMITPSMRGFATPSSKPPTGKAIGDSGRAQSSVPRRSPRAPRIHVHMVSIFVNVPKNDTIITFTNSKDGGYRPTVGNAFPHSPSHSPSYSPSRSQPSPLSSSQRPPRQQFPAHYFRKVQCELEKSYSKLRQYDAQYLTYALLDQAVDLVHPIAKRMRQAIHEEQAYLRHAGFRDSLDRVHFIRNELEKVCRKLKPFMRLLTHVIEDDAISPGATVYLRDVLDNLECEDELLRQLISECHALDVESDKVQSKQMDRTLYTLTVVSSVFLPAQFLTGVWGMNFTNMPELDEKWAYPMFWALTAVMTISLLIILNFGRTSSSRWEAPA